MPLARYAGKASFRSMKPWLGQCPKNDAYTSVIDSVKYDVGCGTKSPGFVTAYSGIS